MFCPQVLSRISAKPEQVSVKPIKNLTFKQFNVKFIACQITFEVRYNHRVIKFSGHFSIFKQFNVKFIACQITFEAC